MRSKRGKIRWGGGPSRRIQLTHTYDDIISVENLLAAWKEFVRGKRKKLDVHEFQHRLMDNILALHRERKGTHKAMNRFRQFAYKVSRNHTRTCWVLKCDIRKFFASIDQSLMIDFVNQSIPDKRVVVLIAEVVGSFRSDIALPCPAGQASDIRRGLPLGNLTSQLLVNVYMNEFDQHVKHALKARYYVRYADDFVLLSQDRNSLVRALSYMKVFLRECLHLEMHPDKVSISTVASGVDFLGWVHFPDHRVLRTSTKRRMLKRTKDADNENVIQSYLGLLSHGNTRKLCKVIYTDAESSGANPLC